MVGINVSLQMLIERSDPFELSLGHLEPGKSKFLAVSKCLVSSGLSRANFLLMHRIMVHNGERAFICHLTFSWNLEPCQKPMLEQCT